MVVELLTKGMSALLKDLVDLVAVLEPGSLGSATIHCAKIELDTSFCVGNLWLVLVLENRKCIREPCKTALSDLATITTAHTDTGT